MPPERLADLLSRTALGDRRAFEELYGATRAKLFAVSLRIVREGPLAEEALQDGFVSIWNHAADYAAGKSAPLTWMTSIVRNRSLDWLRRPQSEATGEEYEIAVESWRDESAGPLERLMAAGEAGALARCLAQLEARQRQSIVLAFFHGLSHSELAGHMRKPLGTVKTHVRRGLLKLKDCLLRAGA